MVADKDGKKTSFQLTPETKYLHGTMAAEASHVTVGQRIVVVYVENEKDKTKVAKQVLLGVTEKDAAPANPTGTNEGSHGYRTKRRPARAARLSVRGSPGVVFDGGPE